MKRFRIVFAFCCFILSAGFGCAYAGASATVIVDPANYQGKCPINLKVTAKISSTSAGYVSIKYVFSSGFTTPPESVKFTAPGTVDVVKSLIVGEKSLPQYPASGWVAVDVSGGSMSNKAYYAAICKNPDIAVTDLTWTPYDKKYMNAPIPVGSIMVKFKNMGTGNTGPITLRLGCEGVSGTGPFGNTPLCPAGVFPSVMSPVMLDLAPGQESSTGIVSTGTMPPKWGGGKYRITAETQLAANANETDKTNNKKVLEIDVPWKKLTDVTTIMLEGTKYKGECSAAKNVQILSGKIAGNGYGIIKYQWIIDGVADAKISEMSYNVDEILKEVGVVTIALKDRTGWGRIRIVSPVQKESDTAIFTIACTNQGFDANLIGQLNISFSKWKSLGGLTPAPQGCQGCMNTFGQISSIDQRSMSLVNEGQVLIKKLAAATGKTERDSTVKRLNEINAQLDQNMAQRNTLLARYNNQVAEFNAQPRKPLPVRR